MSSDSSTASAVPCSVPCSVPITEAVPAPDPNVHFVFGSTPVSVPYSEVAQTSAPPSFIETGFKALRDTYPTWAALRAYLTSVEGGQLSISYQTAQYALIHYVKGKSNLFLPHVRLFRSVVWDVVENLPVSVTPPKSEAGESFPRTESGLRTESGPSAQYVVTPFHDGVMVVQFRCKYTGETLLHTRTYFGGSNTFYSKKTFGEMFAEANRRATWDTRQSEPMANQSFTWILQHPENRVVTKVPEARVVLVHVAVVQADGTVESSPRWGAAVRLFQAGGTDGPADILRRYPTGGPLDQGLCILSTTAPYRRYKVRNPAYNTVRLLRGNNASLDYTWLTLWQAGTLHTYLKAYPEEQARANALVDSWKKATADLFHYYEDIFKRHTMTMATAPPKYKSLLFRLHEQYKTTRVPIGWAACKEFMNQRDIPLMLHVLRWDARGGGGASVSSAGPNAVLSATAAAGVAYTPVPLTNLIVLATAATAETADTAATDYSDMPGLIPLDSVLPPPPVSGAVARVESAPVV